MLLPHAAMMSGDAVLVFLVEQSLFPALKVKLAQVLGASLTNNSPHKAPPVKVLSCPQHRLLSCHCILAS